MPITRDEVAHLARLARLALTDAELDHFAAQLDVIISAVAIISAVVAPVIFSIVAYVLVRARRAWGLAILDFLLCLPSVVVSENFPAHRTLL